MIRDIDATLSVRSDDDLAAKRLNLQRQLSSLDSGVNLPANVQKRNNEYVLFWQQQQQAVNEEVEEEVSNRIGSTHSINYVMDEDYCGDEGGGTGDSFFVCTSAVAAAPLLPRSRSPPPRRRIPVCRLRRTATHTCFLLFIRHA